MAPEKLKENDNAFCPRQNFIRQAENKQRFESAYKRTYLYWTFYSHVLYLSCKSVNTVIFLRSSPPGNVPTAASCDDQGETTVFAGQWFVNINI